MSMLVVKEMWLLVRFILSTTIPSTTNRCSVTNNLRVNIELGLQSFQSTPTSLEAPAREEVMASSNPLANQIGAIAESDHMPVSVQRSELQPNLPMIVEAETSLSPALVQGGLTNNNELPRVHIENAHDLP